MKFKEFIKSIIKRYVEHDIAQVSGQIAYFGFLSAFPFIVFMNFILTQFHLSGITVGNTLGAIVPEYIGNFLTSYTDYISGQNSVEILVLAIGSMIFLASSVIGSLEQAVCRAYGVSSGRSFVSRVVVSLVTTCGVVMMMVVSTIFITLSHRPVMFLLKLLGMQNMVEAAMALKWIFVIAAMFTVFLLGYRLLPNKKVTFAKVIPGTVFSLVCYLLLSAGFGLYVSFATSSTSVYGYIGTVFVALVWIYSVSAIFIIGAEINGYADSLPEKKDKV